MSRVMRIDMEAYGPAHAIWRGRRNTMTINILPLLGPTIGYRLAIFVRRRLGRGRLAHEVDQV